MTSTILQLSDRNQSVTLRDHGAGAPVVLIHGVGMQSAAWTPQINALSQSARVIAVDMPGHGGSTPLPVGSKLPDFVTWFHDVIQNLNLGPVSVAGHSMGALIALGFATQHPSLTSRLALLNGVFRRTDAARTAVMKRAAEITSGEIDMETPLRRWFNDTPDCARPRQDVATWLGQMKPQSYATAYTAFAEGDSLYADALADLTCPFVAITGDGDPNSTPEMARAMANTAQDGRAIVIQGHRHMVNLTAPDEVSEHLAEWLKLPVAQTVHA